MAVAVHSSVPPEKPHEHIPAESSPTEVNTTNPLDSTVQGILALVQGLLALVHQCHAINDLAGFGRTIALVQAILPHDYFACAIARATDYRIHRHLNFNFPDISRKPLELPPRARPSSLIEQWGRTRRPLFFHWPDPIFLEQSQTGAGSPAPLVSSLAIHGIPDIAGNNVCLFYFGNVPQTGATWIDGVLRLLTPHLYVAVAELLTTPLAAPDNPLSIREIEVLKWMHSGKTNDEIAHILRISKNTVKNHVVSILAKLNAVNRTQAAVRAFERGISLE